MLYIIGCVAHDYTSVCSGSTRMLVLLYRLIVVVLKVMTSTWVQLVVTGFFAGVTVRSQSFILAKHYRKSKHETLSHKGECSVHDHIYLPLYEYVQLK